MTELSHWDFVKHFSGYEAAALILGLEPRQSNDETVRVITGQMERDYQNAIDHRPWDVSGNPLENQVGQGTDHHQVLLISAEMEELHQFFSLPGRDPQRYEIEWLADRRHLRFENQKFARKQLICWLDAIGRKSVYQFDLKQVNPLSTASGLTAMVMTGVDTNSDAARQARVDLASLAARTKIANDPKQKDKTVVRECWNTWQKNPDDYESKAKFARDMLEQFPNLESQPVIEGWCRTWERETKPSVS